jgi:hypothetical protein
LFFKPQVEVSTDFRGVARGPGAFHEGVAVRVVDVDVRVPSVVVAIDRL